MSTYEFTLIVEGPDLQDGDRIDALCEQGCDDALVGRSHGVQHLDFSREAPSIEDAVLSAVAAVERIEGARVVYIADADLLSMADIAARTGRTRESVRLLIEGKRGPGGFPPPATDPRSRYRLWQSADVARWFSAHFGEAPGIDGDHAIAALNASLELRRYGQERPERREHLRRLAAL